MEVPGVNRLHDRRYFLERAIHNKNYDSDEQLAEYKAEIEELSKEAKKLTREYLDNFYKELKEQVPEKKKTIIYDGDMKREIAKLIIRALEPCMDVTELKGMFRQGYKIMRTK